MEPWSIFEIDSKNDFKVVNWLMTQKIDLKITLDMMKKLIAEIGFNHMGDEKNALNLIKTIAKAKPWGVMHIGEEEYYDNKKPWRRKLNSTFYKRAKSF